MKFSMLNKLKSCVWALATALVCCQSGNSSAQALNTSENILVKGQPALISSPRTIVYSTNSLTVGTNRVVIGIIPSYSTAEYRLINTDIVPKNVTWQISTNGGSTWGSTFKTGTNVTLSVIGSTSGILLSNIVIYGYSLKYGSTNSMTGQQLLVDTPILTGEAANKLYVDNEIQEYEPLDWASYPAIEPANLDGQGMLLNDTFSLTTEAGALRSASVRAFGETMLKFESTAITSGSNVTSQIVITETNVTIKIASSGITSRPIAFHKDSLEAAQWTLLSTITNVTENYPTPSGGFYTLTFGRLAGDNYFTVFLESTNTVRQITAVSPFYVAAGLTVTGTFTVTNFTAAAPMNVNILGGTFTTGGSTMSPGGFATAGGALNPSGFTGNGAGLTHLQATNVVGLNTYNQGVSYTTTNILIDLTGYTNRANISFDVVVTNTAFVRAITNGAPGIGLTLTLWQGSGLTNTVTWDTNSATLRAAFEPPSYGQIITMPTNSVRSKQVNYILIDNTGTNATITGQMNVVK